MTAAQFTEHRVWLTGGVAWGEWALPVVTVLGEGVGWEARVHDGDRRRWLSGGGGGSERAGSDRATDGRQAGGRAAVSIRRGECGRRPGVRPAAPGRRLVSWAADPAAAAAGPWAAAPALHDRDRAAQAVRIGEWAEGCDMWGEAGLAGPAAAASRSEEIGELIEHFSRHQYRAKENNTKVTTPAHRSHENQVESGSHGAK